MTRHQIKFIVLVVGLFTLLYSFASGQGYRDSIIYTPVTVQVSHDTSYTVTTTTTHDSTYIEVDTIKIPIPVTNLWGMYTHPNQVTIGNSASENSYLAYCKSKGVNMLNCYARAYLYDETKRAQLAAFVKKAKENYGIVLVTVDVRFTDSREEPGWKAYYQKYSGTISMIEPLTEYEPWISSGTSTYTAFFYLIRTMGNLCKQYGVKMNFYEGWVGNNYNGQPFSQAPVDSMVKYCQRIFISNYVTTTDYYSTNSSLGKWDNRMDKRCAAIAVAAPKYNTVVDIVEIVSLEYNFLYAVFACPSGVMCTICSPDYSQKCHSFFGSTYSDDKAAYENYSTQAVLQYTNLIGRTIFYSRYAKECQP